MMSSDLNPSRRDNHPANTRRWANVGLMLGQRRRRWHADRTFIWTAPDHQM